MLITETLLKLLPKFYILLCVCVLMVQINPFIAVSLKSYLLEGYCNACFSCPDATGVAFAFGLGAPSLLAAIFYYYYLFIFKFKEKIQAYFKVVQFPVLKQNKFAVLF